MPGPAGSGRARNHPAGPERQRLRARQKRRRRELRPVAGAGGRPARPGAPALRDSASQGHGAGRRGGLRGPGSALPPPAPAPAGRFGRGAHAHAAQIRPTRLSGPGGHPARGQAGSGPFHGSDRGLSRRERGRFPGHAGDDGSLRLHVQFFLLLFGPARRSGRAFPGQDSARGPAGTPAAPSDPSGPAQPALAGRPCGPGNLPAYRRQKPQGRPDEEPSWQGRDPYGAPAHVALPPDADHTGRMVPVRITEAKKHSLMARRTGELW